MGTKKCSANVEDINALVASEMAKALKMNKNYKTKAKDNSWSEYESDIFKFKNSILEQSPTPNENMEVRRGYIKPGFVQNTIWIKKSCNI